MLILKCGEPCIDVHTRFMIIMRVVRGIHAIIFAYAFTDVCNLAFTNVLCPIIAAMLVGIASDHFSIIGFLLILVARNPFSQSFLSSSTNV
jgi:hypothetical protein